MKKKYKIILLSVGCIVPAIIIYQFLWGRLFPLSPVVVGFEKHESACCIFYIQEGAKFNSFERIDTLLAGVEKAHGLKFKEKPWIYIFNNKNSYVRSSGSRARFRTFPPGKIVVSPWALKEANEGKISLEIYMRHELSHALIFNYTGILRGLRFPPWLMEGIAMYTAKQAGTGFYPGKEETYRLIKEGNFMPPEYYNTDKESDVRLKAKFKSAFMYSEFSCIVNYLVEKYGIVKFRNFVVALFNSSDSVNEFRKVYNINLKTAVNSFREEVLAAK